MVVVWRKDRGGYCGPIKGLCLRHETERVYLHYRSVWRRRESGFTTWPPSPMERTAKVADLSQHSLLLTAAFLDHHYYTRA